MNPSIHKCASPIHTTSDFSACYSTVQLIHDLARFSDSNFTFVASCGFSYARRVFSQLIYSFVASCKLNLARSPRYFAILFSPPNLPNSTPNSNPPQLPHQGHPDTYLSFLLLNSFALHTHLSPAFFNSCRPSRKFTFLDSTSRTTTPDKTLELGDTPIGVTTHLSR